MNTLIIVESPSKAHTIKGFIGKNYRVVASVGHVRDLPKSTLAIDIENNFQPRYINIRGRGDLIKELKKEAKKADLVLLAADPDREGEAISWHLTKALDLPEEKYKRITFNEVTKNAFKDALTKPRDINMDLVDAQQARRILDRIVGYKISPFLWKRVKNGLSAGRVQSIATRIIVEREEEINAFEPQEYWTITAIGVKTDAQAVSLRFYGTEEGKLELANKEDTDKVVAAVEGKDFVVKSVKKSLKLRRPQPPFTTSTLQQEANKRLGFQSQRTMKVAQELYEGINVGDKSGTHGLITYMRTDSLRVSDEARDAAKEVIVSRFGAEFYPEKPNVYKIKKGAQDAHEAVRPSNPLMTPDSIKDKLTRDQYRLYKLIWERFTASQMAPAEIDTVAVDLLSEGFVFRASGETVKFMGYKALFEDVSDENEDTAQSTKKLPSLAEGEVLSQKELKPEQHYTQPPPRYSEGAFLKVLEDKGIGRPSTITSIITTIISRGYVKRDGKTLIPTELGFITNELMKESFPQIIDYNFTAEMEDGLDKVENGEVNYIELLDEFYVDFKKQLDEAEKNLGDVKYEIPVVETDIICDKCGSKMIIKEGRYGKFAACPNYPTCKNTRKLEPEEGEEKQEIIADVKCKNCGSDMILKKGSYGSFYACRNYPDCKTTLPYYKDTGIACPDCGKRIVLRQTKTRKTYYCCEGYPECEFSVWDIPQEQKCPGCGGLLLKKKSKDILYCRKDCGWKDTPAEKE